MIGCYPTLRETGGRDTMSEIELSQIVRGEKKE